MPLLEVTGPEAELLREIAEAHLAERRREIRHTDSARYREGLRERESKLERLADRLAAHAAARA